MTADLRSALGAQRLAGELRRHRHHYCVPPSPGMREDGDYRLLCRCGKAHDPVKSKRGRSNRQRGIAYELHLRDRYGWRKVGQFGDAIDLIARDWKVQAKRTKADPPVWLTAIDAWAGRATIPDGWVRAIEAMEPLRRDLYPLLARGYVRAGVGTRDWFIVRSSDWAAMRGLPAPSTPWLVMTGAHWLDLVGKEET